MEYKKDDIVVVFEQYKSDYCKLGEIYRITSINSSVNYANGSNYGACQYIPCIRHATLNTIFTNNNNQ